MRFIGKDPNIIDAYYTATAEGAITAGKPVIVEADGDVAQVADAGATQAIGSPAEFETNSITANSVSSTFDSDSNKFVVAYGDSVGGKAAVGTVSGTSISFGTPVSYSGSTTFTSCAFDSSNNKVVIAYKDVGNSDYGTAIVGTVSGTSISFGSETVFESAATDFTATVYDANAQKIVIAYQDGGNSDYGTAIVGTVSGTSISFGTPVVFESAITSDIRAVYDTSAQKVVIIYTDEGNSNHGTAIVGTVSGTSVSFGTPVVFYAASADDFAPVYDSTSGRIVIAFDGGSASRAIVGAVDGTSISFPSASVVFDDGDSFAKGAAYDANANRVVIAFRDSNNSAKGTVAVGTVSASSISFGTNEVFESGDTRDIACAYDSNEQKVVIAYQDATDSQDGTAVVVQAGFSLPNLTSENYIGIAADTYADNEDSTIGIVGCIDRNQTGLTAGQQYFVQTDGTLATTADDPSVLAGTAISATELVVKE